MQRFTTPILLAYSAENQEVVQGISSQLGSVMDFKYASIERDQEDSLTNLSQGFEGPVLLFISDNFLRSTKCMQEGLRMLNEHKDSLLPIVIPGYRLQEDGSHEPVETSFERVSDIIQYINFWQDRYLDLRRQKREDPSLNTPGFEDHLKSVRNISAEAGEYLRLLRAMEHLQLPEFEEKHYELLFEFLDAEAIGEAYRVAEGGEAGTVAPAETTTEETETSEPAPVVEEAISAPDAAEEQAEQATIEEEVSGEEEEHAEEEMEEPPIDLTTIPGIGMINESTVAHIETEEDKTEEAEEESPIVTPGNEEEPVLTLTAEDLTSAEGDEEISEAEDEAEESAELLVDKAWRLVDNGDTAAATALLSAGLDQMPNSEPLQYNYALLLAQQERSTEAKQVIDHLLTNNPQHEDSLFLAAELADLAGKPRLAQKYLVRLVRLNDQEADVWYRMGMLSMQKEPAKPEEAERYLKEACKRENCPIEAFYELALLYSNELDKPKKALKLFRKTLKQQADHPFANYDIALLLHKKGKHKKAQEAYQEAIVINAEIKTPENDAAFALASKKKNRKKKKKSTLQTLKDNVNRLEALIHQQDEKAPTNPRPGSTSKTILITGATSGIGRATAEKFAASGYRLIITGRRKKRLKELQAHWADTYGTESHALQFDVRDSEAVKAAIASLPDEWFDIDILLNNAGKAKGFDPIHEGQLEHWEEMIDTNLKGLLYLTRTVSPRMVARGSGHIINVASTAGKEVYPSGNVYCATKHAVDALTKAMRLDLHQHGVRVSQVAPAHVEETEFALVRFDGDAKRAKIYEGFKPLTSRDVAEAIHFISQQPTHVNILDIVLQGTQQADSRTIDRSGRERYEEEE